MITDLEKKLLEKGFKKTEGRATLFVKEAISGSESNLAYTICIFEKRAIVQYYPRWDT